MPNFYRTTREKVIASIVKLGARRCTESTDRGADWRTRRCDCKYGGPTDNSESTGCPELRNVEHVLSVMTDQEWENFLSREK